MGCLSGQKWLKKFSPYNTKENYPSFGGKCVCTVGQLKRCFWYDFLHSYGDRVPKSIPSRIFSIISILTGLVVTSILIGTIATSLTTVTLDKDVALYGTKVSWNNTKRCTYIYDEIFMLGVSFCFWNYCGNDQWYACGKNYTFSNYSWASLSCVSKPNTLYKLVSLP